MSADWARAWLRASAVAVHEQRAWLTELDAAIGDGDHGINLDRGFGQVVARLDAENPLEGAIHFAPVGTTCRGGVERAGAAGRRGGLSP